ncbi:hypothetical protein [Deinococcus sp. SL84]|uniref:hypothetical protein n=1 Tax=Deinococcus sp. SL84 TaxID=2994663 RepID=UPI0022767B3F|nr:hypothetical protein [Deinococcus sp. SL84]MCY1703667.1 hypothetical protein [Deinococcus sp. SL84]
MSKSKKMQRDVLKQLAQQPRPAPQPTPLSEPHEQDTAADVAEAQAWLSGERDMPPRVVQFQPATVESLRDLGAQSVTRSQPQFQPAPPIPDGPPQPAPPRFTGRLGVVLDSRADSPRDPRAPLTTEQALTVRLLEAGMAAAGDAHEAFYDAVHALPTVQKLARRILGLEAAGE